MINSTIKFKCPEYYNLKVACHSHGWKNLSPFHFDLNNDAVSFSYIVNGKAIDIDARQNKDYILAEIKSPKRLTGKSLIDVKSAIKRSLSLTSDTHAIIERASLINGKYKLLVKNGAGRLLRSPSLWEDAAKTLFTTNCSWALTKKICESICSTCFSNESPKGFFPFPPPEAFLNYNPESLKKLIPIGYRANYFLSLAKVFSEDPSLQNLENNNYDYESAYKIANSLNGFGSYASTHLLILCGYYDEIPIDTVVVAFLKKHYRLRKPESFIKRHYGRWKEFKWWGLKLDMIIRNENWLGD